MRAEAGDEAYGQNQCALNDRDRSSAERAADHDLNTRHGRHKGFFEEAELTVPEHRDSREDGTEENGHPDHARRHELQIAAVAGLLKDRTEPEAESEQIKTRLSERDHDLHARPDVTLQFAQPENVYRALIYRLHIFATCRKPSAELAASSRMVEPVNARNAPSSESVAGLLLQFGRRSLGDDRTVIDNGDAVRDAFGFVHVVGGEKDSSPLRLIEVLDVGPEQVAALRIETQRRLIEEQNSRRMQQAPGDFKAALHATGEGLYIAVAAVP